MPGHYGHGKKAGGMKKKPMKKAKKASKRR
jgi:hypothetical protein